MSDEMMSVPPVLNPTPTVDIKTQAKEAEKTTIIVEEGKFKVVKEDMTFKVKQIDPATGKEAVKELVFYFFRPEVLTIETFVAKYGEPLLLDAANKLLANSIRLKARGELSFDENAEAAAKYNIDLAANKPLLIDQKAAETFVPGVREKTSIVSLTRQFNEQKKAGDIAGAKETLAKIAEIQAQMLAALDNDF